MTTGRINQIAVLFFRLVGFQRRGRGQGGRRCWYCYCHRHRHRHHASSLGRPLVVLVLFERDRPAGPTSARRSGSDQDEEEEETRRRRRCWSFPPSFLPLQFLLLLLPFPSWPRFLPGLSDGNGGRPANDDFSLPHERSLTPVFQTSTPPQFSTSLSLSLSLLRYLDYFDYFRYLLDRTRRRNSSRRCSRAGDQNRVE